MPVRLIPSAIRVPIRRSRAMSVSLYRRTPPPVRAGASRPLRS
jgi:hypothetical protein